MTWRVRLEASHGNVLATCSACPPWREHHNSRGPVLLAAATHAELVHADHRRAAELRALARRWAARHADAAGNSS